VVMTILINIFLILNFIPVTYTLYASLA